MDPIFIIDATVWIVEHRLAGPVKEDGFRDMETVIMHVASTKENALKWMAKNDHAEDRSKTWWWVLYPEKVDSDDFHTEVGPMLELYDPSMNQMSSQPV